MRLLKPTLFFLFLPLLLTSCGSISIVTLPDPETSQEHSTAYTAVPLGQVASQTFTARRPRLNGISLWVRPVTHQGQLQVTLYHASGDADPLFTQTIPYSRLASGMLQLELPPQQDPAGQSYSLLLCPDGAGIQIGGRMEDIYPGGQAFLDDQPLQADFAFTTTYDYDTAALLSDIRHSLPRLWLALPLGVLLILPGWLLLQASGLAHSPPGEHLDWGQRVGVSLGLSLGLVPLAMLWSTNLGLRWGRVGLLAAAALLLAAGIWRFSCSLTLTHSASSNLGLKNWLRQVFKPKLPNIGLTSVFLLTLAVRLVMARDLSAPAWVDSVHHATISRLILEQGGFPSTYAPYINIEAVEYHAGYHSLLAAFQWLSGLDAPEAMLLLGQVLNALIVFGVYLLTVSLTRQPAAGVAAAILAGCFTPMPAYYTSWGRYTQLAGLLILPAGFALVQPGLHPLTHRKETILRIILTATAWAGLFMVHYRVAGFLALLLVAHLLSQLPLRCGENLSWIKRILHFNGITLGVALLLSLPWSWQAITHVFAPKAAVIAGSTAQAFEGFYWEYLTAAWGTPALVLAGLGLLISLVRRPRLGVAMVAWTGLLLLVANLGALHLPGGWFVNTISVAIVLFLPIAVMGGFATGEAYHLLQRMAPQRLKIPLNGVLAAAGVVLCLMAARALLPILRPSTDLFRYPDRAGITWLGENLPVGETVLINPMYWGYGTYAGADGGYWITPLTGHLTLPPPVLYALAGAEEKQRVRSLCEAVIQNANAAEALAKTLRDQGIHYIYLGQRGGVLSPELLQASPAFEALYANQGVWIFHVR